MLSSVASLFPWNLNWEDCVEADDASLRHSVLPLLFSSYLSTLHSQSLRSVCLPVSFSCPDLTLFDLHVDQTPTKLMTKMTLHFSLLPAFLTHYHFCYFCRFLSRWLCRVNMQS